MDHGGGSLPFQLIKGDGSFKDKELEIFVKKVKLSRCGYRYVVVSIMGRQNSDLQKRDESGSFAFASPTASTVGEKPVERQSKRRQFKFFRSYSPIDHDRH